MSENTTKTSQSANQSTSLNQHPITPKLAERIIRGIGQLDKIDPEYNDIVRDYYSE